MAREARFRKPPESCTQRWAAMGISRLPPATSLIPPDPESAVDRSQIELMLPCQDSYALRDTRVKSEVVVGLGFRFTQRHYDVDVEGRESVRPEPVKDCRGGPEANPA